MNNQELEDWRTLLTWFTKCELTDDRTYIQTHNNKEIVFVFFRGNVPEWSRVTSGMWEILEESNGQLFAKLITYRLLFV